MGESAVAELIERAVQDDRERLRRRLHDGVLQMLEYLANGGYDRGLEEREYRKVAERAAHALRAEVESSEPLCPIELVTAMQTLAVEFGQRSNAPLHLHIDEACDNLRDGQVAVLAAATREALNNVVKHSRARRVVLTCTRRDNAVFVEVFDDGIGMASRDVRAGGGIDNSIHRRLEAAGGKAEVTGYPGHGTLVRMQIEIAPRGQEVSE